MGFDTAYEAITDVAEDQRWAFGTGFADPFLGLDMAVPPGVDGAALAEYCLMLGDDALIMSHRLQQWLTRAPELEEETALANIGLDLLGQARLLYARAGVADGSRRGEDDFAFLRNAPAFRNVCFVEQPSADFAELTFRLLVFSAYRLAQLDALRASADPVLAAVAAKGVAEVTYHRDYAADWVIRLGDGTDESRARTSRAVSTVLPTISELFAAVDVEDALAAAHIAVRAPQLRQDVDGVLGAVIRRASIPMPASLDAPLPASGRIGQHTAHLDEILDELQSVAREHGGATW